MSYIQYFRSNNPGPGTFIAIAAYDGLSATLVQSLFASQANMADKRLDLEIFAGNCHVDDSRNRLVRDFLESDCEQMVFLDTDVLWPGNELRKLIEYDRDIVAGIYPMKGNDEDYPVATLPGERWADSDGLVEVAGVPTGFLKIRRRVFETLYPTVRHHRSKEDGSGRMLIPVLFERSLNGELRRGGDYEFCVKARNAGFKVYVDPMMQLSHEGKTIFHGCLGHYWRKDVAIPEGIEAIHSRKATPETYLEMYRAWGNSWSLSPEGLYTATLLAAKADGPILECGSGLSTLCIAASTDQSVYVVEHSPMWADKISSLASELGLINVHVSLSGIRNYGEFRWFADAPRHKYAFVLCDGPPRTIGRNGLFHVLRDEIRDAVVMADDIGNAEWRKSVESYCAESGKRFDVLDASNPFAIIRDK